MASEFYSSLLPQSHPKPKRILLQLDSEYTIVLLTCSSKQILIAGGSRSSTQKYSFQSDGSYCLEKSPASSSTTNKEKFINKWR